VAAKHLPLSVVGQCPDLALLRLVLNLGSRKAERVEIASLKKAT
jgi:hypothetical protein